MNIEPGDPENYKCAQKSQRGFFSKLLLEKTLTLRPLLTPPPTRVVLYDYFVWQTNLSQIFQKQMFVLKFQENRSKVAAYI